MMVFNGNVNFFGKFSKSAFNDTTRLTESCFFRKSRENLCSILVSRNFPLRSLAEEKLIFFGDFQTKINKKINTFEIFM